MTNEDQIAALFAEANPVPSLDMLDPLEALDIDPLESRSQRSSVMTDLKTDRPKSVTPARWPRLALLAAIPIIALAGVFFLGNRASDVVTPTTPAAPLVAPIDTTDWASYESERYGFSIGYPSDWSVRIANHDWTLAEDGPNWRSSGQESFIAPNREVRVSAWSVALDPGTLETSADVEAWVEQYCEVTDPSCTGFNDRAVPLCLEALDCPPGLLVPFETDVHAFVADGTGRMLVVAIWRVDGEPSVQPYGGARRLLEAFLSTMESVSP